MLPFIEKESVNVPARLTEKYLKSFVTNIIRENNVESSGFDIEEIHSDRKMIITIERGLDLDPILIPRFQYGKRRFLSEKKSEVEVELAYENDRFRFKIQTRLEMGKMRCGFLAHKGIVLQVTIWFSLKNRNYSATNLIGIINWINQVKEELEEKGFVIEQSIKETKYYIGKQELDLKLKMEDDWFDLFATIRFGEFEIPLSD